MKFARFGRASMAEADDVEARLEALKSKYASKLGDRVEEIISYWECLKNPQDNSVSLEELVTLVHKLAGSAGMYGHNGLGNAAAQLEVKLEAGSRGESVEDDAQRQEVDALVSAIRAELD